MSLGDRREWSGDLLKRMITACQLDLCSYVYKGDNQKGWLKDMYSLCRRAACSTDLPPTIAPVIMPVVNSILVMR